jgi:hypothetical protein
LSYTSDESSVSIIDVASENFQLEFDGTRIRFEIRDNVMYAVAKNPEYSGEEGESEEIALPIMSSLDIKARSRGEAKSFEFVYDKNADVNYCLEFTEYEDPEKIEQFIDIIKQLKKLADKG